MSGSRSSVERLFSPPAASDVEMLQSDAPGPSDSSFHEPSSPSVSPLSPLPESPPRLFVELPLLSPTSKSKYTTDFSERVTMLEEAYPEGEMDSIIGEYSFGRKSSYFVKLSTGLAVKFAAERFKAEHPGLVEVYEHRKAAGQLPPFDPSADYIHPSSRIRMVVKIGPRTERSRSTRTPDSVAEESNFGSEPYSISDSDSEGHSESGLSLRQSTKATMARKKQMTLPFSPKKTRSRKVVFMGEVSDDEDVQLSKPPRRSTRAQRSTRTSRDGDEYSDDLDEDSDDYVETSVKGKSKVVKSKVVRGKASRPAYGHFRVVADLDYDSDEDSAALRAHRNVCEKCHRQPTHELLLALSKSNGKKKRRKREDEFEVSSDEDVNSLGGWVRCLKCPVSAHWGCLAKTQRDEILKAAHERDKAEFAQAHPKNGISGDDDGEDNSIVGPAKRPGLDPYQTTEFICRACMRGGICMTCRETVLQPDDGTGQPSTTKVAPEADTSSTNDVEMEDQQPAASPSSEERPNKELLFRCSLCKRLAHYAHLPTPPHVDPLGDYTAADRAEYYQTTTQWQCADCVSYIYTVEHILAWRLFPENAVEPLRAAGELPDYKSALPREYLVKWADRSYRRTQWVPHMWLLATHANKLKNFIAGGSHITLLPEPILDTDANAMVIEESTADLVGEEDTEDADKRSKSASAQPTFSLGPLPDADKRIQPGWKTVDRILDVLLWRPEKRIKARAKKPKNNGRKKIRPGVIDVSADEAEQEEIEQEHEAALDDGDQPSEDLTETVDEYEKRTNRQLSERDIGRVIWGFFKWNGLGYDNAAWDSPPREGTSPYNAFKAAFKKFIASREVACRRLSKKQIEIFDHLPRDRFMQKYAFSKAKPPSLGQSESLSLMPFQIDGVNWLCNNWWNRQHCILADEMGLGKTVQIVSFLGAVIKGFEQIEFKAFPALVVVPNSTITNWVREFERWAPHLRVVPFYGESKAREVIKNYELFHSSHASHVSNIKYHVLVTTYETITSVKDAGPIFKNVPRWEVLVVDEGQRLKSDSSSIFKKLKDLNTVHRIILTGTPLNNNIRELFNLMNFLDPTEWRDLEALAKEHEVLTEDGIKELHTRLRPYFLRRIKSEVLELPPKNEVIVPVSMSALQKEIYRSILSSNLDVLRNLAQSTTGSKVNVVAKKANMNNMLMQLRKCLQHPYLVSRDIEPSSLAFRDAHEKLISASAKIRMLHMLLPKLKARGHRVLLFSQFKIALDIIEDFLNGEGIKYLRLDGSTKQVDRQRDMDEFNKPNSDVFIYILSTRAGGVGINLWTADTVIIFDPDFNPHQDLQAIARAHRYGQKKTCLVFKFMVKDSAEERIMQTGKKKLVLDHLIVQKMDDDDDTEDVKSILMFGAQTLFEEGGDQSSRDIHYSEHDIDNLIEKTEKEGDSQEPQPGESLQFSFAKVWAAEKDSLEEMPENESQGQEDVWAQTLARIAEESAKVQAKEVTGRGVRRRAAAVFPQIQDLGDTPKKDKEKGKQKGKGKSKASPLESGDEYSIGDLPTDGATSDSGGSVVSEGAALELSQLIVKQHKKKKSRHLDDAAATHLVSNHAEPPDESLRTCGLCGLSHPNTKCYMTESSENLAGYRNILLTHAGDEPLEDRRAAISVIDETLFKRGKLHLVYGQPLHPVERSSVQRATTQSQPPTDKAQEQRKTTINRSLPRRAPAVHAPKPPAGSTYPSASTASLGEVYYPTRPALPTNTSILAPSGIAGPSKRAPSPQPIMEPPRKKTKETGLASCAVCGHLPYHILKACPALIGGSHRIEKEIKRLEKDPSKSSTIDVLKALYVKQRKREQLASSAGPA